jgi:hypothetical protein
MFFNRWNIAIAHGLRVSFRTGRNGDEPGMGTVQRVDRRSTFARAYGAQVTLTDGRTVGADSIHASEPARTPTWQQVNPRAYSAPRALCVDFGRGPVWCVVGTDYGFLHTTSGDVRTWRTASGARRVARAYQPL